jgi:3'(2'), 5'-bisphosphate nucleotidase|tara:strand:- start:2421 stop:3197 length:777 start_codon:yes stop_codon:yes gene_type:complete
MDENEIKNIIESLIDTFLIAGDLSIQLRNEGLQKEIKSDNTPVSNGDLEVNKILTKKILKLTPDIPIVSEETSHNKSKDDLKDFWLIDPIDGTYDYINNKEEFTLNAGLILNRKAVAGLINVPAKNRMFYSYGKNNSFEFTRNKKTKLDCKKLSPLNSVKVVSYSDKLKPEIEKIHKKLGVTEYVKMKSSLKFCVIASGEFDGYVAEPRACEWDIAAGHAILENAGGIITDFDGNEITYGKKGFKNPSLIIKRSNSLK